MRANGSAVCTRTIQIDCNANQLNSAFCYILRIPFRMADENGVKGWIYIWLGNKSNPNQHKLCEQVIFIVILNFHFFRKFWLHSSVYLRFLYFWSFYLIYLIFLKNFKIEIQH